MMDIDKYDTPIQRLVQCLHQCFGPEAFPIEPFYDPHVIGFRSADDSRVYFSVVMSSQSQELFSLQVTMEGPEFRVPLFQSDGKQFFMPFNIVFDRDVRMNELLDVFDKYRVFHDIPHK